MFTGLNNICLGIYIKAVMLSQMCGAKIKSFIDDEEGLSGVVVAILLILVAVLAITMIWGFLSGWLEELWTRIAGADDAIKITTTKP